MPYFTPADYQAMLLSAQVAITATVIALPFGFAVACLLTFGPQRGRRLLDGLVNLPLVLPPVVVGYLLLLACGDQGWFAPLLHTVGLRIVFTWKAAVLASVVVGFPLLVRSIRLGLESIDPHLLHASRTLGAGWFDTLFAVVLPLTKRSLLAGSSLMFARSIGEFGATIIVAGNIPGVTRTIPLAIYDYTATPGGEQMALALCLVAVAIAFGVLFFSESLVRVKLGGGR